MMKWLFSHFLFERFLAPNPLVYILHSLLCFRECVLMLVTSTKETKLCVLSCYNKGIYIIQFLKHFYLELIFKYTIVINALLYQSILEPF